MDVYVNLGHDYALILRVFQRQKLIFQAPSSHLVTGVMRCPFPSATCLGHLADISIAEGKYSDARAELDMAREALRIVMKNT
ncbi:hypothetical protein FRC03_005997 [Tulasnella sp. 419]|nr:hypothetical protein FRC03_005997 [Tulasnella sp. 419]